jgi:hypothetical protein
MQNECKYSRTTLKNTVLNSTLSITNKICHYPKLRTPMSESVTATSPFFLNFFIKNYDYFASKCHYTKLIKINSA